jgi:hypothetical protein
MERAGTGLRKIVAEALSKTAPEEAAVLAWPLVCGTAVADKTQALELVAGVLRVQVPDLGWRNQLHSFLPHYLDAINRIAAGKVTRIEFVIPGEQRKEPKPATPAKAGE